MRARRKAASAKRNPRPGEAERFPFLFGAQYYRAPTPEPACWEGDLGRMRELGFNAVKFFVQWRWSHRAEDRFFFDDLDRLVRYDAVASPTPAQGAWGFPDQRRNVFLRLFAKSAVEYLLSRYGE